MTAADQDAPTLVILAGPNGAGKSTSADKLLRGPFAVSEFVNADTIAAGLSAFHPEAAAITAGRVMIRRLEELVGQRVSFAFETTLASRHFARRIDEFKASGYQVCLVFLWLESPELAEARVGARVQTGGHSVPRADIRRRYDRGLRNLVNLYIPRVDTWLVLDNSSRSRTKPIACGSRDQPVEVQDLAKWERIQNHAP